MKIVGVMSWYDESPHWLATAVSGMARVCNAIVAVDGAYALYPGARARSHPQQAEAILQAAEAAGVGCTVHRPDDIFWGNEVEKRNLSLQLAAPLLTPGEDWLLVFDADFHVLQIEPDIVRHELSTTDKHVTTYTILDGKDVMSEAKLADYAQARDISTEWTMRTRDIYRWNPTLEVGPAHWCYSAVIDGKREWLRGPYGEIIDAHNLEAALVVYHRKQDRALTRQNAAHGYYQAREAAGIEEIERYGPPPQPTGSFVL